MLFCGAFTLRYLMETIFAFPSIALLMAVCFNLAFQLGSPVQNPEKLYRALRLMELLAVCCTVLVFTSFVHIPWLAQLFPKPGVHHPLRTLDPIYS
ncbi:MAG: hypothetical protein ABSG10_03970 [Terracidiphilus sp.]|jgi:hypothetical protein